MEAQVLIPASATAAPRGRLARGVAVGLGALLLTAAGLKLYGLNVTAVPQVGWFSTPRVQVVAAVWELALGLWLLSGAYRAGAWVAAVGTFTVFAAVSGYFGVIGEANCGCFGVVRTSPWAAFSVDVAAIALLVVGRPELSAGALRVPAQFVTVSAGGSALLFATILVASLIHGTPQAALAWAQGVEVTASPEHVDFGTVTVGQVVVRTVEVRNWTDRPVRLIGGTSDCSCVTTANLPLSIPPREVREVTVRMTIPWSKPGSLSRRADLWTDCDKHRTIRLQLSSRIVE